MSNSDDKKNNIVALIVFASSLLQLTLVVGESPRLDSINSDNMKASLSAHAVINSSCSTTLFPNICYSTLSAIPDIFAEKVVTKKDVIQAAINKTKETIQGNFNAIKNLTTTATNLTKRCKMALDDCLEMVAETLEGLDTVIRDLRAYPTEKSLEQQANDLKTLMSTTITNIETCLDGFSHDLACKQSSISVIQDQEHGGKMCSNALAMIKNMTDTDVENKVELKEEKHAMKWPQWLSARDRKLLVWPWGGTFTPNVIVDKSGKGNYTTVAAAVEAAPTRSRTRYVIKISAGVYTEYIEIPKNKTNLMFIGDKRTNTIITGNKSFAGGISTLRTATVAVLGNGFLAREITFENTAGASGHQAVALRVSGDSSAFYRCAMLAYQDTLYALANRQFYVNCMVVGTIDFIFGNAASVFQFCDILARRPNPHQSNMVTAQGRTDPNQNTGIVIQKCKIGATSDLQPVQKNFSTYLGRPWKMYSRTVVMGSLISDVIDPVGWHPWEGDFALDTLYYREYENTGPGADTSKRVKWKGWAVMKYKFEAIPYTIGSFINAWSWLLFTGFPFWPGW